MKRLIIPFTVLILLAISLLLTAKDTDNKFSGAQPYKEENTAKPAQVSQPMHEPVVINMSKPSSGGNNNNFPAQQPAQEQAKEQEPSYSQIQWKQPVTAPVHKPVYTQPQEKSQPMQAMKIQSQSYENQQQYLKSNTAPGTQAAIVVHHHPYVQGYIRKKLQKMGVKNAPNYIANREEVINTDKQHSIIAMPKEGPGGSAISAAQVSARHYNDPVVKNQMTLVSNSDWKAKIKQLKKDENETNHYYWHTDNGFNYCHYEDSNGYHWYGWYIGGSFFWTRHFHGRWWWYDADYDRWCFWNNGFWWWQDPYHMGDLYCYDDEQYVPCNSADDDIIVTGPENASMQSYTSPDNTRIVKVDSDTQDAFLFDNETPPAFVPIYLASGVKNVMFSDTSNGRPLEIVLTLNDGSFDMFDGQGTPYNPGNFDADQAAQGYTGQAPQEEATPSDQGQGQ